MKGIRRSGGQSPGIVSANDPARRGLANHLALFIKQKNGGAGGLNLFAEVVPQRQGDDRRLANYFYWRHGNHQLRMGRRGGNQAKPYQVYRFHFSPESVSSIPSPDIAGVVAAIIKSELAAVGERTWTTALVD
jgi:hypothetical protein